MADTEPVKDADLRDEPPHYRHILNLVAATPWALLPAKLAVILDFLSLRASGVRLSAEEIQERIGAARQSATGARQSGSVAVLPLMGTLIPRASMMSEASGMTSLERWTADLRQAIADPAVGSVVLDVDSPGGSVFGVQEAADAMRSFKSAGKPIVAVANQMAASAAYWLASQADELVVTPSGEVGSIGVIAAHEDLSAALEREGVKVSLITAGKYKGEGSPFEPLSEDTRGYLQSRVNDYYRSFVAAVARGRGTTAEAVRDGYGQGRMMGAKQAVQAGMADRVATLDRVIGELATGKWEAPQRTPGGSLVLDTPTAELLDLDVWTVREPVDAEQAMAELQAEVDEAVTEAVSSLDLRRRRLRRRALA
jgi:signal peptide peptidase SppA